MKIGILLGSPRTRSNARAVVDHISSMLKQRYPDVEVEIINLQTSPGHPLPLLLDETITAGHTFSELPNAYSDPAIRAWSATVLTWNAVLVVSPQYNWGPPAPLKNAFDHLFKEWNGMPGAVITLGGHGGNKAHAMLVQIMTGGLKMSLVEESVEITLPSEVIRTDKRLDAESEVIKAHEARIATCLDALIAATQKKQEGVVGKVML